ncbi:hypothetical protein L211DRAFT_163816 [Terfezia boudieri ATCC MYA-4762]|uniref:DNA replication factor Cdt1 C-terminal domain-containing protein n=1 Tax=Terfezia boudieri ATCC MYA-4762 TaxID=1051890 RepID=A0A3N4LNL6_9PEZI|nr:hypothetical protein L211DRAFT_163816 [Terfezia boudieri ATCC MYA-4762]
MPPTRSTARKSARSTNTDAGTLKSAFKDVGKSAGLKVGKNVGVAGVAAAKAAVEKTGLVGVVIEGKKMVKGRGKAEKKVKESEEKAKEEEIIEVIEVKGPGEKEKTVEEAVEKEVEKEEEAKTVTVEKEVAEEVIEPVEEPVEKPVGVAKVEKSTKGIRGKKRKAVEASEEKFEEKVTDELADPVVTIEESKDTPFEKELPAPIRARKRTRLQKEPTNTSTVASTVTIPGDVPIVIPEEQDSDYVEEPTNRKAPKTPRKKAATKPKTPRPTRNAKFLSIAASALGQTTLNIPPVPAVPLSTAASNQPSAPTSEVTLSSINTLLTVPEKEEEKRPPYLQHLANLHAHLLTAIHLHHAQNGLTSLPDFKGLKPHLERLSKRTVQLVDLRRVCWITNYSPDEKVEVVEEVVEPEAESEVEVPKKGRKAAARKAAAPKKTNAKAVKKEGEGRDIKTIPRGWLKTVDYGHGKIVLELVLAMAGVGEVNSLRKEFCRRVDVYWKKHGGGGKETKEGGEVDVPMSEVIVSENKKMVERVLKAKGQRRLLEMKGVQVLRGTGKGLTDEPLLTKKKAVVEKLAEKEVKVEAKPAETNATPALAATIPTIQAPQEKKLSLLDRIRAKHQASLAAAAFSPTASLTPEEIAANHAQICAQQRLPEVIPILRSLRLR